MPAARGARSAAGSRRSPQRALGAQMRRASIPALARVVHRLGVEADWVVFGHVHRCGPLAGDDPRQWRGPGGAPRIANTGSWVYEPLLLHHVGAAAPVLAGRRDPAARRAASPRRSGCSTTSTPPRSTAGPPTGQSPSSSTTLPVARRSSMSLQRLGRALEREALADDRPDEALVGQAVDLGADLAVELGLAQHVGAPAGTDDLDVVEQQAVDPHLGDRAAGEADDDRAPALAQRAQAVGEAVAADRVEDDVDAAAGELLGLVLPRRRRSARPRRRRRRAPPLLLVAGDDGDRPRPQPLGDLQRRRADAAGGAVDEHGLALGSRPRSFSEK